MDKRLSSYKLYVLAHKSFGNISFVNTTHLLESEMLLGQNETAEVLIIADSTPLQVLDKVCVSQTINLDFYDVVLEFH